MAVMRAILAGALIVIGSAVWGLGNLAAQESELLVWQDNTGKFSTEARFVKLRGDSVVLEKSDGQQIEVPLERLGAAEQARARDLAKQARAARDARNRKSPEREKSSASDPPVVSSGAASEETSDWWQWRGPQRQGHSLETGLLTEWTGEGPPEVWRIKGLGGGFSSCSIVADTLFTLGQFGDETRLLARDAVTGEPRWEAVVGRGGDAPNATPTVSGDYVLALSHAGDLLCAERSTGREVWRKNFPRDFGGKMMSQWGYSEAPLVDEGRVIVTPGGTQAMVAALDLATGKVIWTTPFPENAAPAGVDGAGYSSIVISQARGVKHYVQLIGRGVIGVAADNGRLLWGYNRIANTTANIPTPLVIDDFVLCSTGYEDGGTALLKIVGNRQQLEAQEVWYQRSRDLQNHHGGMIQVGDYVYLGHGHNNGFPVCLEWRTGRQTWDGGRGPGTGSAAILYAEGHLYFRYENAVMALIEANPQQYRVKGKFKIGIHNSQSWSHPVIWQGKLYLRCQDELICYNLRSQ